MVLVLAENGLWNDLRYEMLCGRRQKCCGGGVLLGVNLNGDVLDASKKEVFEFYKDAIIVCAILYRELEQCVKNRLPQNIAAFEPSLSCTYNSHPVTPSVVSTKTSLTDACTGFGPAAWTVLATWTLLTLPLGSVSLVQIGTHLSTVAAH